MTSGMTQMVRIQNYRADFRSALKRILLDRYIYLILLPGLVFYIIFSYIPMYGITLAFKHFNVNQGILASPFVGFKNFTNVFSDPMFWRSCGNTIIISFGKILFTFPVPVLLAILINELREGKYKKTLQTVYTFPHFLSWVIIAGIMNNFLGSNGALNNLINLFGLERQDFLANTFLFRPILYASEIWKESGWSCIIYLATISTINPEIYEAATVDGANRFVQMRHITWPGMRSTVIVLLILSVGNVMNAGFDQIFNLYNPVVYSVGDIIDTYIYRISFQSITDFGFSTAVGFFKSIINFALLIGADRIAKMVGERGIF